MTNMTQAVDLERLKALAEKAATYVVKFGEVRHDHALCPLCDGDGEVPRALIEEIDPEHVVGIQYFGVGDCHRDLQQFVDAANPQTILALISRLEAAERERDEEKPLSVDAFIRKWICDGLDSEVEDIATNPEFIVDLKRVSPISPPVSAQGHECHPGVNK